MANVKTSELPGADLPLDPGSLVAISQPDGPGWTTRQVPVSELGGGGGGGGSQYGFSLVTLGTSSSYDLANYGADSPPGFGAIIDFTQVSPTSDCTLTFPTLSGLPVGLMIPVRRIKSAGCILLDAPGGNTFIGSRVTDTQNQVNMLYPGDTFWLRLAGISEADDDVWEVLDLRYMEPAPVLYLGYPLSKSVGSTLFVSDSTLTLTNGATDPHMREGQSVQIVANSALTLVAGSGVTIRSRGGLLSVPQYGMVTAMKTGTDQWHVWGDLV